MTATLRCAILMALACVTTVLAPRLSAQPYPSKPVRFVLPSSAGGSDDFHARLMAQKLTDLLGQQFVVDNRPGAGGLIGQQAVITAAPDGYTILLTGRSITAARFLNAHATFDPLRVYAPAAQLVTYQFVLVVHPSIKANTVSEYIALARAQPGKISYAAPAGGLMPYIAAAIFRGMTKVELLHIPYKTAGQTYNDLLSGQVDSYFAPIPPALAHIHNAKLRALGVTGDNALDRVAGRADHRRGGRAWIRSGIVALHCHASRHATQRDRYAELDHGKDSRDA